MKSDTEIPLVAIIVPCYNQGQYLGECLDSVLVQTVQDWVCIVVDDGSTDDTAKVAEEYCLKSDKIHYHYQENAGLPATRNKGIALTDSEYILPLDADDMLEPNYLEVVLGLFEENPEIKIAYTNCRYFGFDNELLKLPTYNPKTILTDNQINATALYKRSDYEKTQGYDPNLKGREDWDFWLSLLNNDDIVAKHPDFLFLYRQRQGSMNRSLNEKDLEEIRSLIYLKHSAKFQSYPEYSTLNKYLKIFRKRAAKRRFKAIKKAILRRLNLNNIFK